MCSVIDEAVSFHGFVSFLNVFFFCGGKTVKIKLLSTKISTNLWTDKSIQI